MTVEEKIELTLRAAMVAKSILALVAEGDALTIKLKWRMILKDFERLATLVGKVGR